MMENVFVCFSQQRSTVGAGDVVNKATYARSKSRRLIVKWMRIQYFFFAEFAKIKASTEFRLFFMCCRLLMAAFGGRNYSS